MARTPENGLKYFSLDTNFFENDKVQLIEAEFGHKGIYILVRLLCKIYSVGYCYNWSDDQCFLLQRSIGMDFSFKLINEVVYGCVRRRFFDKRCFDVFGMLTSKEIQSRYIQGIVRRTEIEIVKDYWLLDKEPICKVHWIELAAKSDGRVIPKTEGSSTNTDVNIPIINKNTSQVEPEKINVDINRINDYINPQRKVKERKVKEDSPPPANEFYFLNDFIENNAPNIIEQFKKNPLSAIQQDKLLLEYGKERVESVLLELDNSPKLVNYKNLYNTLTKWIIKRIEFEAIDANRKQTSQQYNGYRYNQPKSRGCTVSERNEKFNELLPTILAVGNKYSGNYTNGEIDAGASCDYN